MLIRSIFPLLVTCACFVSMSYGFDASDVEPLKAAMAKQSAHSSAAVAIQQEKKLPTLSQPITTTGYLWLQPGKAFRWQTGNPKVQTAIFDGKKAYFLDERKKTVEHLGPLDRRFKMLKLILGIGKDSSFEGLMENFSIHGIDRTNDRFSVSLLPKKPALKRGLKQLQLHVNTSSSFIERIEWSQVDGTEVVTSFATPTLNQSLPPGIFTYSKSEYKAKS